MGDDRCHPVRRRGKMEQDTEKRKPEASRHRLRLLFWRSQGDLNPCRRDESPLS